MNNRYQLVNGVAAVLAEIGWGVTTGTRSFLSDAQRSARWQICRPGNTVRSHCPFHRRFHCGVRREQSTASESAQLTLCHARAVASTDAGAEVGSLYRDVGHTSRRSMSV